MFIYKTFTAMLILILLTGHLAAQQNSISAIKPPDIPPQLQKDAVEFLRQTIKEIPNLKTEENRQYFKIEMARLLWKYDEKESRRMFEEAVQEVKQSLAKMAEEYKKSVEEIKKARTNANSTYGMNRASVNAYSGRANSMYNAVNRPVEVSDTVSVYETGQTFKLRKISNLRRRLIENLTDIDPTLAYQFLTETAQIMPIDNSYNYRETYDSSEKRIVAKLLEKGETDKSVEIARQMLDKDFPRDFLSILTMIYQKDAVKGGSLSEEVLQKLKTPKGKEISSYSEISFFFDVSVENSQQKPPMLSEKSLRELARLLGQEILANMDKKFYFNPYDYAKKIKEYAPRESLKILQKSNQMRRSNSSLYANKIGNSGSAAYQMMKTANYPANRAYSNYPVNYPINYAANMANYPAMNASNTAIKTKNSKVKTIPTPPIVEIPPLPVEDEPVIGSKEAFLQKLKKGEFKPEEHKKVVEAAKEYAFEINRLGYARPDRYALVVNELTMFALASKDKGLSDLLMKETEIYVRPETKNYVDYFSKLMLAVGYSMHHPDKSFVLMESLTSINQVIENAVNLGTFIDTEAEFVDNGEVSAVLFLGEGRFMQNFYQKVEFPMFIQNLAKADFKRTKGLADKFEKPEVKMTAKMLILESLLGEFHETGP